jgi:hypothetical protein
MSRVTLPTSAGRRICLVRVPPFVGYGWHHPPDVTLPFALAWMATLAARRGWFPELIDAWASRESMRAVVERLRSASPDVVVFEAHAAPYQAVVHCARAIRDRAGLLVAFGSVPTFTPGQVVGPDLPFHVALQGEAEVTLHALLERIDAATPLTGLPGLALWNEDSSGTELAPRDMLLDLDELPLLDYDLLDLHLYHKDSFPVPTQRRPPPVLRSPAAPALRAARRRGAPAPGRPRRERALDRGRHLHSRSPPRTRSLLRDREARARAPLGGADARRLHRPRPRAAHEAGACSQRRTCRW